MMNDVTELSRPRLLGSAGEKKTLEYLDTRMKELGVTTRQEPFEFSILPITVGFSLAPVIIAGLVLAASWTVLKLPWMSAALSVLSLALIPLVSRWSRLAEKLFDLPVRRRSVNLIGEITAESAVKDVIFIAHYDSKSQTLPIGLRIMGSILSVPLAAILSIAVLSTSASLFFLAVPPAWMENSSFWIWVVSWVPAGAVVIMFFNFTRNKSPGALDNASGCAVLLELAARFSGNPPDKVNLIFLFTGAEEYGLAGAIRYAQTHAHRMKPDDMVVVNIDSVGCGSRIGIVDRYGMPPVQTTKSISDALAKNAQDVKRIYLPIGVGLDMFPFALRGIDSVSITSASIKTLFHIHTKYDTLDRLDAAALERAVEICAAAAGN